MYKLIVLFGPAGAGKDYILKKALEEIPLFSECFKKVRNYFGALFFHNPFGYFCFGMEKRRRKKKRMQL